jgi:hypothetical protein
MDTTLGTNSCVSTAIAPGLQFADSLWEHTRAPHRLGIHFVDCRQYYPFASIQRKLLRCTNKHLSAGQGLGSALHRFALSPFDATR